jgi:peptidoglycan/LPS O-acetylase OafA/YrhL
MASSAPHASSSGAPPRHAYLDGWRGLAILLVLENHFFQVLPLDAGRLGVDVFFCLSGLLMSGILFLHRQPLRLFYRRRLSRILPAFLVFVLGAYAVAWFRGIGFTWQEVLATVTFLRTYLPAEPGIWETAVPIAHLWSLNIEEHCYLVMSLLVCLPWLRGREGLAMLSMGFGCILVGLAYVRMGDGAPHWGELGTEVAAAHLFISAGYRLLRDRVANRVPPWLPVLTLALAVACYSSALPWWARSVVSPFLLAFSVNHLAGASRWFLQALESRLLGTLGVWSFSIYLWQQPFYQQKAGFWGGAVTALACSLLVAWLSYRFVEQPCRDWLNRRWAAPT